MAKTKYDGKDIAFKFGALTIPATHLISVDWPRSRAELDVTGATQDDKEFLDSERESTITVNCWDDLAQTIRAAVLVTTVPTTADYWPQGNTTGKPKRSAALAFTTSVSDPATHNAAVPITFTLRVDGAITETTVSP